MAKQESADVKELTRIKTDYNELRKKYLELQEHRTNIRKLEAHCKSTGSKLLAQLSNLQSSSNIGEEAGEMKVGIREMDSSIPVVSNTLFLRLIIGDIPVVLPNREDKLTYKQNYEKFKMLNVVVMLLLGVAGLIFTDYMLPSSLVHIMSVWYYFTVTIRELVLISNGSRIKTWWLIHHYCSIAIAALLLTWPPGECYNMFKLQFLLFTCVLSLVMCIQFRYQRAKLYRQVAMGEKHHMSVSSDMKISSMKFLLANLVVVYLFQFYNGYTLLRLYSTTDCPQWQVPVLGLLFLVVATANASTLSNVVYGKSKIPNKKSESFKSF